MNIIDVVARMEEAGAAVEDHCECGRPVGDHDYWEDKIYDVNGLRCQANWNREYRHSAIVTKRKRLEAKAAVLEGSCLFHASPQAPETWQPIATAPKDAVVLVHDEGYVGKGLLEEDGRWLDVEIGREDAYFDPAPTEWMPLPAAPQVPVPENE